MPTNLEDAVLAALRERPASGGKLIERFQAEGSGLVRGRAVLVYGALSNLAARGSIAEVARSDGEIVWGMPGTPPGRAAPPGFPPSFSLSAADLAQLERAVYRLTRGLPHAWFEELRRVVVADADRRVFHGEKLPRAAVLALDDLGPPAAARRHLRRAARGRPAPLALRAPRLHWLLVPVVLLILAVLTRLFLVGVYTVPAESISMAPTLFPAAEGGDRWVFAWLGAYWFEGPRRGDVVVFRTPGQADPLVKRAMALPGERWRIGDGDLYIDGALLVKERALLDRVGVPLLGRDGFRRGEDGVWRAEGLHRGYLRPDGSTSRVPGRLRDVIVRARVRATGKDPSVALQLEDKGRARAVVSLRGGAGRGRGFASVDEAEVAKGDAFTLPPGGECEVWLTNADGVFRAEIRGREVARAAFPPGWITGVSFAAEGAEVADIRIGRDLLYGAVDREARPLAEGEYLLLGDNSAESRDSRAFGPVPRDAILGRVFAVAWPPSRARVVR